MKKIIAILIATVLYVSALSLVSFATGGEETKVFVTVSNKGELALVREEITLTDADSDGALTVNDALYLAHEVKYVGGAAAGYGYYTSDYGLSMSTLWGDSSGSFGYYRNNASCFSLAETLKDGDSVYAFIYASSDWSDIYSFFDTETASVKASESVTLTLSASGYDANWAPVTFPLEGASLTVNGAPTEYKTDADGKITIALDTAGEYVISATHGEKTVTPAVCMLTVEPADSTPTGDGAWMIVAIMTLSLCGALLIRRHVGNEN